MGNLVKAGRTTCGILWLYCGDYSVSIHCFDHSNADCIPIFLCMGGRIETILRCRAAVAFTLRHVPGCRSAIDFETANCYARRITVRNTRLRNSMFQSATPRFPAFVACDVASMIDPAHDGADRCVDVAHGGAVRKGGHGAERGARPVAGLGRPAPCAGASPWHWMARSCRRIRKRILLSGNGQRYRNAGLLVAYDMSARLR